jgi:hypothetical protein
MLGFIDIFTHLFIVICTYSEARFSYIFREKKTYLCTYFKNKSNVGHKLSYHDQCSRPLHIYWVRRVGLFHLRLFMVNSWSYSQMILLHWHRKQLNETWVILQIENRASMRTLIFSVSQYMISYTQSEA